MDKVVLRTVFNTLIAILALFGVMMLLLCFVYPSTMMQLTYDMGMEEASMKYAERAYNRSEDVYYAAFGFETAIGESDYANVEKFGGIMIADEDGFTAYCEERNQSIDTTKITYKQYVYGQISVAQYKQGEKTDSVATAFSALSVGEFPQNNAVVSVLLQALTAEDTETLSALREGMEDLQGTLSDAADEEYLVSAMSLCGQNG